jgi:hypothetical protein
MMIFVITITIRSVVVVVVAAATNVVLDVAGGRG